MTGLAGGVGLGLVWGWLLAGYAPPSHRPIARYAALAGATAVALAETAALADATAAVAFLVAACLALASRLLWHSYLTRYAARLSTGGRS